MKNIHILPTTQPSRLAFDMDENFYLLCEEPVFFKHQELVENRNIYITSDEEIKGKEWFLDLRDNFLFQNQVDESMSKVLFPNCKKIILTTDPTLIADGVQSIDDNFLKWFVKNSSCDFVNLDSICKCVACDSSIKSSCDYAYKCKPQIFYKIIIPQEEPKQEKKPHSFCETPEEKCVMNYCDENGCQNRKRHLVEPHEQDTLEELKSFSDFSDKFFGTNEKEESKQTEIMYSEQEVLDLLYKRDLYLFNRDETKELELPDDWFEQFKKK